MTHSFNYFPFALWFGIVWCWRSISCFRLLASLPYMSINSRMVAYARQLLYNTCFAHIPLPKIAASLRFSYENFRKIFKTETGISPLQYTLDSLLRLINPKRMDVNARIPQNKQRLRTPPESYYMPHLCSPHCRRPPGIPRFPDTLSSDNTWR